MQRSRRSVIYELAALLILLSYNSALSTATAHKYINKNDRTLCRQSRRIEESDAHLQVPRTKSVSISSKRRIDMHLTQKTIGIRTSSQSLSRTPLLLNLRGGAKTKTNAIATKTTNSKTSNKNELSSSWSRRELAVFQSSSFLIVLSLAIVAFSPAPALIAEIGSERATSTLSILTACAAMTEMIISPAMGSLLDSIGRKPALVFTLLSIGLVNGAATFHSSVLIICIAKFVRLLCAGLFFITSQVIVSDIAASNPERMSSTLGVQYALIGGAFFVGAIGAGWLSGFGLSFTYGTSTIVAVLTALLVSFGMSETLLPSEKVLFQGATMRKQLLASPWSCTRILYRHSREVRILAILAMLQSLPTFMGDTFQILAKTEWNLGTKDFSSFVAMFGIINIAANVVGSQMVVKLGIKQFTAVATLSSILSPLGASFFSFRGIIAGSILGFLGSAQMLGVTAALVAEGTKSNVPQGELAGERSSFLALMKVIAPIWYSMLYVQGKKILGTGTLPFLFNAVLGLTAFGISQRYMS